MSEYCQCSGGANLNYLSYCREFHDKDKLREITVKVRWGGMDLLHRAVLAGMLALAALLGNVPDSAQAASAGAVFGLRGTPHIWIMDSAGTLHWGGDTRALAGKQVSWSNRTDLSATELQKYPIGDPWLSAGLLKSGDPIYLVKWEADWAQPKLQHIQSIDDVRVFGISASNYGRFVMEESDWQRQYGMSPLGLQKESLASAIGPVIGSRQNPYPMGQDVKLSDGWNIKVVSVTPNANSIVAATNQFNKAPKAGGQFFMVRLRYTRTGSDPKRFLGGYRMRVLGSNNVAYTTFQNSCGVIPEDLTFGSEVYTNGSLEGNVCWQVSSSEVGSLVMFDDNFSIGGGTREYLGLK